jgi:hypothetical protein
MNPEKFVRRLAEAEDLIKEEKYQESLNLLSELKEIELQENFDNSITHKLYQLISNAESLLNQKNIIEALSDVAQKHDQMDFEALSTYFRKYKNLDLTPPIIRREIELLILRDKIPYKIKQNSLIFQ